MSLAFLDDSIQGDKYGIESISDASVITRVEDDYINTILIS